MFFSDLPGSALITFGGDDARAFLHGQLTSDVAGLAEQGSQYSGYCTPKGRLLASFLLWREAADYVLQLPAALREATQKRLSMYILRSRVKAADASAQHACFGVGGQDAAQGLARIGCTAPQVTHGVSRVDGVTVIRLPVERYEIIVPTMRAAQMRAALSALGEEKDETYWHWLEIRAGIATILPATREEFVPQMVNFDAIGAVSFSKGCYPGQEIVARTHYLGRLKQRMVLAHLPGDCTPRPGDRLYGVDLGDQASGMIANAAAAPGGGHDVLAVAQTTSLAAGPLRLGSADGPPLELLPLPYAI